MSKVKRKRAPGTGRPLVLPTDRGCGGGQWSRVVFDLGTICFEHEGQPAAPGECVLCDLG